MSYFQNSDHFRAFLNKVLNNYREEVDIDNLVAFDFILSSLKPKELLDRYGWSVKSEPRLLEHDNFIEWLRVNKTIEDRTQEQYQHIFTAPFLEFCQTHENSPGVYSFWSKSDKPLYIGMSICIGNRCRTSFFDKFKSYNKPIYGKFCITKTASDAAVLEVFYIAKLKPALNGISKYGDDLTFSLVGKKKLSNRILCNQFKEGVY